MRRYYAPPEASVLLLPVGFALMMALPLIRKPSTLVFSGLVFVAVFLPLLRLWRRYLRVEVVDGCLRGRNPETFKWTEVRLSEVTSVAPVEFGIGRIKGWRFASPDEAVFVNRSALYDAELRAILQKHSRAP